MAENEIIEGDQERPNPLGTLKFAGRTRTEQLHGGARLALAARTPSVVALGDPPGEPGFSRADVVVEGVDHSGPSFEVRVFANNAEADAVTPLDVDHGYLGSFHVFGHGICVGEAGHCEVTKRGEANDDLRSTHPLRPATKKVVVTEALRKILGRNPNLETVTLVPIGIGTPPEAAGDAPEILKYERIRLLTYD